MAWINYCIFAVIVLIYATSVDCGPKYAGGGFMPSSADFLEKAGKAQDQVAMPSQLEESVDASSTKRGDSNDISERNQEPRFGYSGIGGTGYGGVSTYAPTKIDLGGVLLGAVIGVGTILIIPKLLYVFSGSYGAYSRSEDGGLNQMMLKVDDALARHGIDTTSCMQRAVCSYAKQASAATKTATGDQEGDKISSVDKVVEAITTNQVFRTAMEGTAIQEAVEAGREGKSCVHEYSHCGFSMEAILSLLSTIVSSPAKNTRTTAPSAPSAPL